MKAHARFASHTFVLMAAFICLDTLVGTRTVTETTVASDNSAWQGFSVKSFQLDDGAECKLILPDEAADGSPWIWRARFFGHEPQTDIALLKQGFHLVYCDVAGLFGSEKAIKRWDECYDRLVTKYGLAKAGSLEGMSRGGLIVFRWAATHPDRVNCIYADAPVCDFKSWPGGKGTGEGNANAWKDCQAAYGFNSEPAAIRYDRNPIDLAGELAESGIPILIVYGKADTVVPPHENCLEFAKRYRKAATTIQMIGKDEVGHHPHSLVDPKPIVDFILQHTR